MLAPAVTTAAVAAPAAQYAVEALLAKTRRFRGVVERLVQAKDPRATVDHVSHDAFNRRYRAEVHLRGRSFPLVIKQKIVDDFIEGGSRKAEERIARVLDIAFEIAA